MATEVPTVVRDKLLADGFENVVSGDEWPDKTTTPNAILVLGSPSPPPEHFFSSAVKRRMPHFQVLVRDETQAAVRTTAHSIYDALDEHIPAGWTKIVAAGEPLPIGRDDNGLRLYSINFASEICE